MPSSNLPRTNTATPRTDDACYLGLKAKDARFDGLFFAGVTSTGVYCRPVCRVKTPKRENCRFFSHAAQAELAGFRPCLRCRPELAPRHLSSNGVAAPWSVQDASSILAHQAAHWLDTPESWGTTTPSVSQLARHLGVSDRHLRRIFEAHWGVAPVQYLQTCRLLLAKQLLTDTRLPVAQIALHSGYASVRRFNSAFSSHYRLQPTQLRKLGSGGASTPPCLHLSYRPPYDVAAMLGFFQMRSIDAVELVQSDAVRPLLARTLRVSADAGAISGWIHCEFDSQRHCVAVSLSDSLYRVMPVLLGRVRAAFDLDADPLAINAVLHSHFPLGDGLRVPGSFDGFELAVRAVLGQQISVAAARTLTSRLVQRLGDPIVTPWPELNRLFPSPTALLSLGDQTSDVLGSLGIVRQRQQAIVALARALQDGQLNLHPGVDVPSTLVALNQLPGIGDWTAQYIAMRALRWPDAIPAGDVALQKALGVRQQPQPARAAEATAQAWQPWRSYAVLRAWSQPTGDLE